VAAGYQEADGPVELSRALPNSVARIGFNESIRISMRPIRRGFVFQKMRMALQWWQTRGGSPKRTLSAHELNVKLYDKNRTRSIDINRSIVYGHGFL